MNAEEIQKILKSEHTKQILVGYYDDFPGINDQTLREMLYNLFMKMSYDYNMEIRHEWSEILNRTIFIKKWTNNIECYISVGVKAKHPKVGELDVVETISIKERDGKIYVDNIYKGQRYDNGVSFGIKWIDNVEEILKENGEKIKKILIDNDLRIEEDEIGHFIVLNGTNKIYRIDGKEIQKS